MWQTEHYNDLTKKLKSDDIGFWFGSVTLLAYFFPAIVVLIGWGWTHIVRVLFYLFYAYGTVTNPGECGWNQASLESGCTRWSKNEVWFVSLLFWVSRLTQVSRGAFVFGCAVFTRSKVFEICFLRSHTSSRQEHITCPLLCLKFHITWCKDMVRLVVP